MTQNGIPAGSPPGIDAHEHHGTGGIIHRLKAPGKAHVTAFQGAAGPARREAAEALYLRLTEVPPFVVLCFKNGSVLTQWRQISGLTPTQQNIFYEFAQWNIA